MTRTLYQTILGADFDQVPPEIRRMHSFARVATGSADVTRGRSAVAGLICYLARLPEARKGVAVETHFAPIEGGERWTRVFGKQPFQTDMMVGKRDNFPCMEERLGPFLFMMRVIATPDGIDLTPEKVYLGPLSIPLWLSPKAIGRERVKNGKYSFFVEVTFPFVGKVFGYSGWLEPSVLLDETGKT